MLDRKQWSSTEHESRVEKFYGTGISGFHDYHQGYLNFGLWTREGMSYVEAAENLVRHMGKLLNLTSESRLLDVGFGMGTQDVLLRRTFNPQSIDGLDVTWKHVERARERANREGVSQDRVRFHHGTATRVPFPDANFTHVLCIEAAEHINTREDFFHEAYRVLRPGGVLAISDYSLARKPKNFFEKIVVEFARRAWQVPRANVYGNEIFKKKLETIGFHNVAIENVGDKVIVGYYLEQRKWETVKEVWRVRGFSKGVVGGCLIDWGLYRAYKMGLVEYIILKAVK